MKFKMKRLLLYHLSLLRLREFKWNKIFELSIFDATPSTKKMKTLWKWCFFFPIFHVLNEKQLNLLIKN